MTAQISLSFRNVTFPVDPLDRWSWPTPDQLGLDVNQFDAFRAALTKQFVIIQGPPGTGKTFVGMTWNVLNLKLFAH